MASTSLEQRLSRITTNWDDLIDAHRPDTFDSEAANKRGAILKRYAACVYRYIFGATRCHHAAEDLSQEFALRFIRGDYRNANPQCGRFRDYLKQSLRNLVTDHFRRQAAKSSTGNIETAESSWVLSLEDAFSEQWREQLLGSSWESLRELESESGSLFYSVLQLRSELPAASSDELAQEFSVKHDRHVSADWFRQTLRRARRKFAHYLVQEVSRTIQSESADEVNDELATLGLQKYIGSTSR